MKTTLTKSLILSLMVCIINTLQLRSQTTEPDAPIRGWGFDEFHIGGEEIYNPSICRNSLNMDFTYHYGGYSSWTYMDDPVRHANDRNTHRLDRFFSMAKQAQAVGLKLIYAVDTTFFMQKNIRSYDWYYDSRSDTVDIKDFRDRLDSSNAAVDSVYWIRDRFIAGVAVSRSGSSTADSLFTMGAPRFTQLVTTRGNGVYYTNYLKVPDSSMWFDFRVMLKTNQTVLANDESIADNAPLAYLDVIRRVVVSRDASCDSCRCPFYVRIAHLPITKQMYIGQNQFSYDHKQFTFLMNLLDTSRSDGQVYGQEHLGYPSPTYSDTLSRCDSVLALWKQQGIVPPTTFRRLTNSGDGANVLEQGDLHFNITSTRLVPLQVLGGSISQHIFDYLDRPQRYSTSYRMDSLIFSQLDTLANDTKLWPMMAYMALWDEPIGIDHNAYRIITSKIQRRIRELHPTDQTKWRGCYYNSLGGFGTLRVQTGDFDSTAQRSASLVMYHAYPMSSAAPAYYANKDSMDPATFEQYFNQYPYDTTDINGNPAWKAGFYGSTYFPSTVPAYQNYTRQLVGVTVVNGNPSVGGLMTKLRANKSVIDDAQFKFQHLGKPKIPVYNNVQQAGYLGFDGNFTGKWSTPGAQPRTPEVITAGAWLSLNAGNQGIMFSDLLTSGHHFGIFSSYGVNPRLPDSIILQDRMKDYDTLRLDQVGFSTATHNIPGMWLGYKQRFNAIQKVTSAIKRLDTLYTKLEYNPAWQISVERSQDPPKSALQGYPFSAMPLVDSAYTIQANRTIKPDTISGYRKYQSDSIPLADSIQHTYLEITHYKFKDQQRSATGERVLLVTNKRTWPIDWDHSTDSTKYWDGNYGLGAIDVRLPVLRLKNSTGVVADSFIIERVGEPYAWRDTGAFGQDLPLQWLEPGWGAMYRMIPLASGVSDYGSSFSNAVRSLNTSTPSSGGTRYLAYERDSVVYLRALSAEGAWGKEFMLSDRSDLDSTSGKRNGYNLFPALAKPYQGHSLMVVWEHHDSLAGNATVQACYLDTLLLASDTLLPDTTRMPLSLPKTLTANWMRLAPSIVGIDSGYVVSWSRLPLKGIEMVAVHDVANPSPATDVSLPLKIVAEQIDVGFAPDTNAWHSTLAYVPTRVNQTAFYTSEPGGPYTIDTIGATWNVAHIAYQQGIPEADPTSFIFYNKLGVIFRTGQRPVTTRWRTEHVTKDLPGCRFLHPCIAADSARIGVAFQNNRSGYRLATLRFRDSLNGVAMRWGLQWKTPTYSWGWDYLADWKRFSVIQQYYERPSLTHFPAIDRNDLLPDSGGQLQGGLTWVWTNPPASASGKSFLKLYRYGWTKPEEPGPGHYPTMTLAPYVEESPWENSSLFYRHDTTRRFFRAGRRYYPAFVLNTPTQKSQLFRNTATRNRIYSYGMLARNIDLLGTNECGIKVGGGFHHDFTADPPSPPNTPQAPKKPGLPPTFFGTEAKLDTTVEHISTITRSGVFQADTGTVTIGRTLVGSSDVVSWLNGFGYDTARNSPADVWMMTELIRVNDSSVVWRGDTTSARQLGDTTIDEEVEIPVGSVVSAGTAVFVRMRMEVSATISDYSFDAGFHTAEQYDTSGGFGKTVRIRRAKKEGAITEKTQSQMAVAVRPNPATESAELQLRVVGEGEVQLRLYTMLGQQVRELPQANVTGAGEYSQQLDLSGLRPGIYLLVAQQGNQKASAKVTVVGK